MELVLPEKYVELEQEEMQYLDGGAYLSANDCIQIAASIAMSPGALIAGAAGAVVISKIVQWAKFTGGPLGWIVGTAAGYATGFISKIAYGIGKGAISGRGLSIDWSWDPFNFGTRTFIGKADWA
ncbi:hypothetical protein [Niallia sp. 03133]|uniref:hypothetical protein n=1 Tax=Niallia sp. 03133 TaxID=3458060 RepID=UPI0040439C34